MALQTDYFCNAESGFTSAAGEVEDALAGVRVPHL